MTTPQTALGTLKDFLEHFEGYLGDVARLDAAMRSGHALEAERADGDASESRGAMRTLAPVVRGYADSQQFAPSVELAHCLDCVVACFSSLPSAEAVVATWRGLHPLPENLLEADPTEAARRLLPPDWERAIDVLGFFGPGGERIAWALRGLGQQRICVWLPAEVSADARRAYPPGTRFIGGHTSPVPPSTIAVAGLAPRGRASTNFDDLDPLLRWFDEGLPPQQFAGRVMPGAFEQWGDQIQHAYKRACKWIAGNVSDERLQVVFGKLWARHMVANVVRFSSVPSTYHLRALLEGASAVCVAPGPSLSRNVEVLRRLKGRAVIITVSQALGALARAGVAPDFVLATDPQDIAYHWSGYDLAAPEALLFAWTLQPELWRLAPRRLFGFSGNHAADRWGLDAVDEGEDAVLESGGSVACNSVALACTLGCKLIVLAGQDLSFGPAGEVYAAGLDDGVARIKVLPGGRYGWGALSEGLRVLGEKGNSTNATAELKEVPGYYGGTVLTGTAYAAYRDWFGRQGASVAGSIRCLNATEGGAAIENWDPIPLAEVADKLEREGTTVDVPAALEQAYARCDLAARRARGLDYLRRTGEAAQQARTAALALVAAAEGEDVAPLVEALRKISVPPADGLVTLLGGLRLSLLMDRAFRAREPATTRRVAREAGELLAELNGEVADLVRERLDALEKEGG